MMYEHVNGVALIYFVRAEIPGALVKIGYSESFGQRFAALRSENACRLAVLGVQVDGASEVLEQRLHRRFVEYCVHDEWFTPVEEILRYIREKAVSPYAVPPPKIGPGNGNNVDELLAHGALPPLMTIDELAKLLSVSTATIRRRVKKRHIPFVQVGGQIRFDIHEFARDQREELEEAQRRHAQLDAERLRQLDAERLANASSYGLVQDTSVQKE